MRPLPAAKEARYNIVPNKFEQAVRLVIILNLGYFGVEFAVALQIGSVSLFADSIDFLEDASVNFLILFVLGWSAPARSRVEMVFDGILLVPGLATLWMA
jgi:Co/Zn/Cd efflux system component